MARAVGSPLEATIESNARASARERLRLRLAWQTWAVGLLVAAETLLLSWALVAQHRAFNSNGWDLGWFDQIVWNSAHGRLYANSFAPWSFLGEHVEPVLLLFALVYRIKPDVELLLLTQSVVAVAAALPLYFAARSLLHSATAGLLVAAAFLVAPLFANAVLFDFHPEVMGVMSVFAALALLAARRPGWALLAIGSAFLLKEDAALVGVGFAWVFWLFGYRRSAVGLLGASLVYFVLVTSIIMPYFRGGHGGPQARWSYLGDSGTGIIAGVVTHPGLVVDHLSEAGPRHGAGVLLGEEALLPLVGPAAPVALPLTAAHLLSEHDEETRLDLHYGVLPLALTFVAAVLSIAWLASTRRLQPLWRRVDPRGDRRAPLLAGVLLAGELAAAVMSGPFGLRLNLTHYRPPPDAAAVHEILAMVPPGPSVAAQSGLVPHLSERRQIWEFPPAFQAQYVVIDLNAWGETHGPPSPDLDYGRAVSLLPSQGYCLLAARESVQLWTLNSCTAGPPSPDEVAGPRR